MVFTRFLSFALRLGQLVFAAIVTGLTAEYLDKSKGASAWDNGRFIYTVVVAALSVLLSILWLLPFASNIANWFGDIFVSILWFVAFGLLVNQLGNTCGAVFNWGNVAPLGDQCGKFKAIIAFSFLSAILWLVSAIVGFLYLRRRETVVAPATTRHSRRRWHRSRV